MKTVLLATLLLTSVAYGQQSGSGEKTPPEHTPPEQPGTEGRPTRLIVRRLESVSWNPVRGEFTWVLSVWDSASPDKPVGEEHYTIQPDDAVMEFQGEQRGFDSDNGQRVRTLLNVIARFAMESTVWWGRGGGTPSDKAIPGPNDRDRSKPEDTPAPDGQKPKPELKTPILFHRPL